MKKSILSLLALGALLVSCEEENKIFNEYAGKWIPEKIITNGNEEQYVYASCGKDYIKLNEFLTFESVDFVDAEVFDPNTNEIKAVCTENITRGSYRVVDNAISIQGSTIIRSGEISVNGNEMRVKTTNVDVNGDGVVDEQIIVFHK